jgi:hypothetical protein
MSLIPALKRLKQEYLEFQVILAIQPGREGGKKEGSKGGKLEREKEKESHIIFKK